MHASLRRKLEAIIPLGALLLILFIGVYLIVKKGLVGLGYAVTLVFLLAFGISYCIADIIRLLRR